MPFFSRIRGLFKKPTIIVTIENRKKTEGGPHGFDARERGRRGRTMRLFDEKRDLGRSIKEEWKSAIEKKAEEAINNVMEANRVEREKALEMLRAKHNSVEDRFWRGNTSFVLRYDFRSGQFYWRSTRRLSETDLRHERV